VDELNVYQFFRVILRSSDNDSITVETDPNPVSIFTTFSSLTAMNITNFEPIELKYDIIVNHAKRYIIGDDTPHWYGHSHLALFLNSGTHL